MASRVIIGLLSLGTFVLAISACSSAASDLATSTPASIIPTSTAAPIPRHREPSPTPESPAISTTAPAQTPLPAIPIEAAVELIPLEGAISSPDAEVSGMNWHGDRLLILPQYPEDYLSADGFPSLFAIPKAELLGYLDGKILGPPETYQIPIFNTQAAEQIPGYEGFEAIAIDGNQVYLAIEANDRGVMQGYLIQGTFSEDGNAIDLNPNSLFEIATPVQIFNAAYETLVVRDGQVLALFEANGRELNPEPLALLIDPQVGTSTWIASDNFEYRFTDATDVDSSGHFWVLNVFMPIEFWFYSNSDPIDEQYGLGITHQVNNHVERLLELKYNDGRISLSGKPPVYLELIDDVNSRNWEAVVRLDERGFLAMTDSYPGTILGYIPFPDH
jgi:hypothetical protein